MHVRVDNELTVCMSEWTMNSLCACEGGQSWDGLSDGDEQMCLSEGDVAGEVRAVQTAELRWQPLQHQHL